MCCFVGVLLTYITTYTVSQQYYPGVERTCSYFLSSAIVGRCLSCLLLINALGVGGMRGYVEPNERTLGERRHVHRSQLEGEKENPKRKRKRKIRMKRNTSNPQSCAHWSNILQLGRYMTHRVVGKRGDTKNKFCTF